VIASDDLRWSRTPATTTASTPDAPTASAGKNAAKGTRSHTMLRRTGSFQILLVRATTRYTAKPMAAPPRPTRKNCGTDRASENRPLVTACTAWA
jgi:hypothetical protein